MEKKIYREVLGERLKLFREERGLSMFRVARRGGINPHQVAAVESGDSNYTVDSLLGYILGCDLYMYFAEKSENRERPHDFNDMVKKGIETDPDL
jgi:transcriptional regulator with XRE-family HTH domain